MRFSIKDLRDGLNLIVDLILFSTINSEFYKNSKMNIEDQDTELYTTFIVPFNEEFIKTKYEKILNIISQPETPAPEEIEVHKSELGLE